jgi:hypothetical protein
MSEGGGSYHIHMEYEPYCQSFSYYSETKREATEQTAQRRADEEGGVVVGPFDFDWSRCAYRRMMEEEVDQRQKEAAERVSQDETIPENERTAEPSYASLYRKRGLGSWHVHTDGNRCVGRSIASDQRRSGFVTTPIDPRILASLDRSTTQPSPVNTFTTTIQPTEQNGKHDEACYPAMAG